MEFDSSEELNISKKPPNFITIQEFAVHRHNGQDSPKLRPEILRDIMPVYQDTMLAGTNNKTVYRQDVSANSIINVYADLSVITGNWTVVSIAGGFIVASSATPELYNVPFNYTIL